MIKHACRSKVDIFIAREGYSSFQERDVSSWFFFPLVNKIDRNTRDEGKMLNYKHCSRTHTATKQKCQTGILRSAKLFQLFHIYDFLISTIIIPSQYFFFCEKITRVPLSGHLSKRNQAVEVSILFSNKCYGSFYKTLLSIFQLY